MMPNIQIIIFLLLHWKVAIKTLKLIINNKKESLNKFIKTFLNKMLHLFKQLKITKYNNIILKQLEKVDDYKLFTNY